MLMGHSGIDIRILLADESESSGLPLMQTLEAAGYYIRWVRNGLGALEAVDSFIPDLALISLDLPEMNGFEVCEVMVQNPELQHTVIVALLDSDSAEQHILARSAGFHYCFRKPVNLKTLERLLKLDMQPVPGHIAVSHSLFS